MALSDKQILEEKKKGDIIIEPYNRKNLNTSSYDVTLGEYFFREKGGNDLSPVYNMYNKKHTDRVWGTEAEKAITAKQAFKDIDFEWVGITPSEKVILIHPGETILAHTTEYIGGLNHITTSMQARSTMGRNFIEVCKCAGWGDVGYVNRWTMEITNNSKNQIIPLVVGRRIAQLVFMETGETLGGKYGSKESHQAGTGNYQSSDNLKTLKKTWSPNTMLPKAYTDRDIKK